MQGSDIIEAIRKLVPTANWSAHEGHNPVTGEIAMVICWHDANIPQPSDEEIKDTVAEIIAEREKAQ